MKFLSIFMLCLSFRGMISLNNFADIPCGSTKISRSPKVVGGENAIPGEFPWLVSITRRGGHFCGGSLITRKHVLTAAHCLCVGFDFFQPQQIKLTLSEYDLTKSSPNKVEASVESLKVHPNYTCDNVVNDIAILEIKENVKWSNVVAPVCLPAVLHESNYRKFEDDLATIAGWGWTKEGNRPGDRANILQTAKVNIIGTEKCQSWYKSRGKKVKIQETQMCAGYENGGIDACRGDSGGPLMVESKETKQIILAGIVSTGIGCAKPYLPGLYTRVSEYIPWIQSVIQQ